MTTPSSSALAVEVLGAEATLAKSHEVESQMRLQGNAAFWFAHLYARITRGEIEGRGDFTAAGAPFVMNFIPIFYDLYVQNIQHFQRHDHKLCPDWTMHFARGAMIPVRPDIKAAILGLVELGGAQNPLLRWLRGVTFVVTTGVSAHIRCDMPIALETAYRDYTHRYRDAPAFADLHQDLIERGGTIFSQVRKSFLDDLINRSVGMRVLSAESLASLQELAGVGLPSDQILEWRQTAWDIAAQRLKVPADR